MIKNIYFKENIRIKIDSLNKDIHLYEVDKIKNILQLMNNGKINKLCVLNIDDIFIKYLNQNTNLKNLKQIEIQNSYLKIFIESKIIFHDLEELNIHIINDFTFNIIEIFNIFPNISILILYIQKICNLNEIIQYLNNSKIETLHIYFEWDEFIPLKSQIILQKIKNLKLVLNQNIIIQLFNYIQIPNLKNYQLNLKELSKINDEEIHFYEDDFNSINLFLNKMLKNKDKFIFKNLLNLPIKKITSLSINLKIFSFNYQNGKNIHFCLFDEFKKYYLNYDFSVNEKDIFKYKKLKIEGLNNKNKIEEIIEKEKINLCDINLNIDQTKYYIKSFKEVKSIYCGDEIEKNNFYEIIKDIIIKNGFSNLKHINITIGYINESPYKQNKNHFYFYLSKLIQNSENLKSLILKLHPDNFIQNIPFYFSLIENLKQLRIVKIFEKPLTIMEHITHISNNICIKIR